MEEGPQNILSNGKGEGTTDYTEIQWTIETTAINYTPINQKVEEIEILRNVQYPSTKPVRNRKCEQTNYL